MSIKVSRPGAYADLGDVWLRDQAARILEKHLQFGQHFRLDVDLLLAGRARAARGARAAVMSVAKVNVRADHARSATSPGAAFAARETLQQ
jgi:hypothetical protein